ncbi:MAG: response regulator transcription factor [Candidatus Korobacteraceae bacterium]
MRILIADDNLQVRRGIARLLSTEASFHVVGEAGNAPDTIQQACELLPDVILLDLSMSGSNGLDTARTLRQRVPRSKILIVSQHEPGHLLSFSMDAGAIGCVDKARISSDLLPALKNLEAA